MVYTTLTKKAMNLAYEAHSEQIDKGGIPYIYHPIHLAEQMDSEIEVVCALLHDVVEDTSITFADLEADFPSEVITVLRLLTRDKKIDYMDYIKDISKNAIARKIKIADLKHNMDETRLDIITDKVLKRVKKYLIALSFLQEMEREISPFTR